MDYLVFAVHYRLYLPGRCESTWRAGGDALPGTANWTTCWHGKQLPDGCQFCTQPGANPGAKLPGCKTPTNPGAPPGSPADPQPPRAFPSSSGDSQLHPTATCSTGMPLGAGAGRVFAGKSHHTCLTLWKKESHGANAAHCFNQNNQKYSLPGISHIFHARRGWRDSLAQGL